MNEIVTTMLSIGTLIILVIGAVFLGAYLLRKAKERKVMSPKQLEHKNKEVAMLKNLLDDIVQNTDNWFVVHEQEHPRNAIINDLKNVGIIYTNNLNQISIYLNLKTLTHFNGQDPDTVMVSMVGPHVGQFLRKAEATIDKRGNELEFFGDKLYKQL